MIDPEEALRQLTPAERHRFLADHGARAEALAANRYLIMLLAADPPDGSSNDTYVVALKDAARAVAAKLQAQLLLSQQPHSHTEVSRS